MRFKSQRSNQDLPEVNLIPMMNVLMAVLAFFVIISMSLTGQQIANVQIPQTDGAGVKESNENKPSLVVGLTTDNEMILEDEPIDTTQLATAMQEFLTENPEGVVLLKADRELDYSRVVQLLKTMRDIGGDRVSLAIQQQQESAN
jgi:biopolymer transport protein ExbD